MQNNYLSAAIKSATDTTSENFQFDTSRILSASPINSTGNIPEVTNIPETHNLEKKTIQESKLNTILDFDNYQLIINNIKKDNITKYGKNWVTTPTDKSFFHTELLGSSYNISKLM
jgi:hypothetical protein